MPLVPSGAGAVVGVGCPMAAVADPAGWGWRMIKAFRVPCLLRWVTLVRQESVPNKQFKTVSA